ncbi:MAG: type II secretion system F family protein [Planctomycetaceae bacterium]
MAQTKPLDLQDLALLNQEIAALVRAGVPLESGLAMAGRSGSGAQEILMLELAQRLRKGESFAEALHSVGGELPKLYRAVVEAGARTGRLPEALESLAMFAQETLKLRRRIDLALLYPTLVLLMSSLLFTWLVAFWVPRLSDAYFWLQIPETAWVQRLVWLNQNLRGWAWIIPAIVTTLGGWWWFSTRGWYGLKGTTETSTWSAFQILPGINTIVGNFRRANFCDLMAMLLDHQVPLPEASLLAAEASGDRPLQRVALRIATGVRAGRSLADCLALGRELPLFVSWMLICGERQGTLIKTLRQMADVLRQRAAAHSDWLRMMLPTVLVVLIGGTAVLAYALAVFVPMSQLLHALGNYSP